MVACNACNKTFANATALSQHRAAVHGNGKPKSKGSGNAPRSGNARRRPGPRSPRVQFSGQLGVQNTGKRGTPLTSDIATSLMGATEKGRAWALRALHPCDDREAGGEPVPSQTTAATSTVETRFNRVFTAPDVTKNWDIQFVCLATAELPIAYRVRPAGGSWTYWQGAFSASATTKPGLFTITPAVGEPSVAYSHPALTDGTTAFRQTFCGFTWELDCASLSNQGMVFSGQYAEVPIQATQYVGKVPQTDPQLTIASTHNCVIFDDVPLSTDEMVDKVPTTGIWPARQGCYMPMRFTDDVHLFRTDASTSEYLYTPDGGQVVAKPSGCPVMIRNRADTGELADTEIRDFVWTSQESDAYAYSVTNVVNQQVGVVFFTGISGQASVYLKMRKGIQLQPSSGSQLTGVIHSAGPKDQLAIDAVSAAQEKLQLSYPAKYNSLGAILPLIWSAVRAVAPMVAPWLVGAAKRFDNQLAFASRV